MSRSARLLDLIQALRRYRRPVPAAHLADELGVSLRTIYRDVATLVAGGAPIDGAAGLGYLLRPGFTLPPLMFAPDEIDALVLGLRLVARRTDPALARAAVDALAKIAAVLPAELESSIETSGLLAGPSAHAPPTMAHIRRAIRAERKLLLRYVDKAGAATERIVWPVALGFFDSAEILAAWCEQREAFRHFRLDRVAEATPTALRYPTPRRRLLAEWRREQRIGDAADRI